MDKQKAIKTEADSLTNVIRHGNASASVLKDAIAKAIEPEDIVGDEEVARYWINISLIEKYLKSLIDRGKAELACQLTEHAYEAVARRIDVVGDMESSIADLHDLEEIFRIACIQAHIPAEEIARTILAFQLLSDYGPNHVLTRWANVFGEKGSEEYRRQVQEKWEEVTNFLKNDNPPEHVANSYHWRIKAIVMEIERASMRSV